MPVGVTRHSSPPGAVRRQACASHEPKVSSPSSPLRAWLAFSHTPAGVTDAISANPLLAICPCTPICRPLFWRAEPARDAPTRLGPAQVSTHTHILWPAARYLPPP